MNHIEVLGRLTKDPEVRYTPSGKVVCSFTLAVDRPFQNGDGQREADFIPVVVWGKAAELIGNSAAKGHRLLVEGRLQIRNFDGKDGTRHWVTEIIASNFEFIERRSETAAPQGAQQPTAQAVPQAPAMPVQPPVQAPAPAPAAPAQKPQGSYRYNKPAQGSYGGQQQPQQATAPQHGGYVPQQGAYAPQQAAYTPQQGGYQPQQAGYNSQAGNGVPSPFDEEVPF